MDGAVFKLRVPATCCYGCKRKMLEEEHGRGKSAARLVGENKVDKRTYWVLSESVQLAPDGSLLQPGQSPFLWL